MLFQTQHRAYHTRGVNKLTLLDVVQTQNQVNCARGVNKLKLLDVVCVPPTAMQIVIFIAFRTIHEEVNENMGHTPSNNVFIIIRHVFVMLLDHFSV